MKGLARRNAIKRESALIYGVSLACGAVAHVRWAVSLKGSPNMLFPEFQKRRRRLSTRVGYAKAALALSGGVANE